MLLIYGVLCVSVVVLQKMDQKSNTFASINDSEMASMRNMCELISASINSGNVLSVFMIFEEWSISLAKLSKSSVRKNLSLGKPTKPTINFPPSFPTHPSSHQTTICHPLSFNQSVISCQIQKYSLSAVIQPEKFAVLLSHLYVASGELLLEAAQSPIAQCRSARIASTQLEHQSLLS